MAELSGFSPATGSYWSNISSNPIFVSYFTFDNVERDGVGERVGRRAGVVPGVRRARRLNSKHMSYQSPRPYVGL